MKTLVVAAALLIASRQSGLAQGAITIDNSANTSTSTTATSNGLIFNGDGPIGSTFALYNGDISFNLFAGTSSTSLVFITSGTGTVEIGDSDGPGIFTDNRGTAYNLAAAGVPGGGIAWIELQLWAGTTIGSFSAAINGADPASEAVFQNAVGTFGSTSFPLPSLTGMPAMFLPEPYIGTGPEPTTLALVGVGAAALLFHRRHDRHRNTMEKG